MNSTQRNILTISFLDAIKICFMLFMSLQISLGQLIDYSDGIQITDIELTEEGDSEQEEKEEIDKDEFLNKLCFSAFSSHEKSYLQNETMRNWGASQVEVPTPPPRFTIV
jgi:hypothetical protein